MFSLKIIDSAKFLKMPVSTQALYFHLCMRADDDGIAEGFNVLRMIGATEDDLRILVAKGFITILNEDLVSYITDWNEHNKIRADRKIDSIYKDLLIQVYPDVKLLESKKNNNCGQTADKCQTDDGQMTDECQTNVGIGKVRLGKDRVGEDSIDNTIVEHIPYKEIMDLFNSICTDLPKINSIKDSRQTRIRTMYRQNPDLVFFENLFKVVQESNFLCGRDTPWKANFDWVIKPANLTKIIEGNYTNKQKNKPQGQKSNMQRTYESIEWDKLEG
jgi:hypothetical protein